MILSVDTCDCIIELNDNENWISSKNNCRLHKSLKGQNHVDSVLAQNRRFNYSMGQGALTEEEEKILTLSKRVNKLKIRSGDFSEDIPDRPIEMSVGFWQNLRNRLPI